MNHKKITVILVISILLISSCSKKEEIKERFSEGENYIAISPVMYPFLDELNQTELEQIPIIEVFSYACPACAYWVKQGESWIADIKQDDDTILLHIPHPGQNNPTWFLYAQIYYVLQYMELIDELHYELYTVIHDEKQAFYTQDDFAQYLNTRMDIAKDTVIDAFNSDYVTNHMKKINAFLETVQINGTPSFIVANKYIVMPSEKNSNIYEIINFLLLKEKQERQIT